LFAFSSLTTASIKDADFNVVARLESFNKGHGVEEAFRRAESYHAAGADAILCHSKREDDGDIRAFMAEWGTKRCPVVIVPSQNWKVPSSEVAAQGVSTVIWANHNMRATVRALQDTTREIFQSQSVQKLEEVSDGETSKIVNVSEVRRLQVRLFSLYLSSLVLHVDYLWTISLHIYLLHLSHLSSLSSLLHCLNTLFFGTLFLHQSELSRAQSC
jgi:hypothetical protein